MATIVGTHTHTHPHTHPPALDPIRVKICALVKAVEHSQTLGSKKIVTVLPW